MKELQDIDLKALIETETRQQFNREGYVKCPFHNEKSPSLSVKFFPDRNKYKFKCWGCSEQGDAIDFIMKFKNLEYKAAREYLGMENIKTDKEEQIDRIKSYIDWQLENAKKGYELLGIFQFVDKNNKAIYYKAKFRKPDGKKETPYYHIEGEKIINTRGVEEVPFNLHNVLNGIDENKVIIFTEGEKDVNTINSTLKGLNYVATSIKGVKDLDIIKSKDMRVYVLGDTGEAGEKYKWHIFKEFNKIASEFRFISLPGLKALGDNKDCTDWLEDGHSKEDLLKAFSRSLDMKNKFELHQDLGGIYKFVKDKENEGEMKKDYIADFRILEAKRLRFIEEDKEGIKLIIKSKAGNTFEKVDSSTVFDDIKSFKNFLGSLDITLTSTKIEDLTKLKIWINKYLAIENEEIYQGDQFVDKNGKLFLITSKGAISSAKLEPTLLSNNDCVNVADVDPITKDELLELKKHIFRFASPEKTICIIGTILNDLAIVQNAEIKEKLHHLLIVGESGSGKSTILDNVVAAILNYPLRAKKSVGLITPFAMIRDLSMGNYPSLYDEFKPSMLDRYKILKLSDTLRNLYDRTTVARSDKSFKNKDFRLSRPIIIAGEESYPNSEKPLMERSCIVYLSRRERTTENTEAMKWIVGNEKILNKFGRAIINEVLNLKTQEYSELRNNLIGSFPKLSNRVLTTALNIASGIEIFNILLRKYRLKEITKYEDHIYRNLREEILDGGSEAKSTVEQMLVLYNDMIEDGRALDTKNVISCRGDGLYIRTSEMINQIYIFTNQVGSAEVTPLKARDFKKQASKAGYLITASSKFIKVDGKSIRFDEYSKKRMRELNVNAIIEPELTQIDMSDNDKKVIEGMFGTK